jgi:hypothetical protein
MKAESFAIVPSGAHVQTVRIPIRAICVLPGGNAASSPASAESAFGIAFLKKEGEDVRVPDEGHGRADAVRRHLLAEVSA